MIETPGGVRVPAERLRALIGRLFAAHDVPPGDAETLAEVLVEADLRGVESHGCTRVAGYLSMIESSLVNPQPTIEVLQDTPSIGMLDGDRGFGIVVAKRAMEVAMDKGQHAGIGCVTMRNATHTGMIGFYPMMAARRGLIGLAMNNGPPDLPPFGGRTATLSTNPVAAAFPARRYDPILLDMAASVVAVGKLHLALKKGIPVPEGWAMDRHGVPTSDPHEAIFHGFLQWAGGHKGFGLAVAVEILSGVLSGGLFGTDVPSRHTAGNTTSRTSALHASAFYVVIDPAHFMPLEEFQDRVDRLIAQIKSSERAAGAEEIRVAGELGARRRAERMDAGIPLSDVVFQELRRLAEASGVAFDIP